ncbi:MAG: class IV adenylate cyclase [Acidobacteria bacterium]|nr:class IV adenylate cyclase [Acidobacteriota bacterium]
MREVEIRALVPDPDAIQARLVDCGFEFLGFTNQRDIVIDKPDASLFNSGQKIRIRLESGIAELTYKGAFEGSRDASRRKEINIAISPTQVDDVIEFLSSLGLAICFVFAKARKRYARGDLTVNFDTWPIIGCVMEIEGDESEAKSLAREAVPGVEFGNFRLRDFFQQVEIETGLSLRELQTIYERRHGTSLGRLDLLMR